MTTLLYPFIGVLALFAILGLRVYILLPQNRQKPDAKPQRDARSTCSLGVFFGSGGHSAEMKTLLSTLDFGRYTPRRYIACHGDDMSLRMIGAVEGGWEGKDRHEVGGAVCSFALSRSRWSPPGWMVGSRRAGLTVRTGTFSSSHELDGSANLCSPHVYPPRTPSSLRFTTSSSSRSFTAPARHIATCY